MPRTKEVCPAGAVRDRPPLGPLCTQLSVGTGRASPKCRESSGVGWGCCRALGLGRPPRARMGCNHRPKGPKDSLCPPGGPQHCAWAEACRGSLWISSWSLDLLVTDAWTPARVLHLAPPWAPQYCPWPVSWGRCGTPSPWEQMLWAHPGHSPRGGSYFQENIPSRSCKGPGPP